MKLLVSEWTGSLLYVAAAALALYYGVNGLFVL